MEKIDRDRILNDLELPRGEIIIAVYPNKKKKSFHLKGLATSSDRRQQLREFPEDVEFLRLTTEWVETLLDIALDTLDTY